MGGLKKKKKIRIECGACRTKLKLKEYPSGRRFECPDCNAVIDYRCPHCNTRVKLKQALKGKKFRCSSCDEKVKYDPAEGHWVGHASDVGSSENSSFSSTPPPEVKPDATLADTLASQHFDTSLSRPLSPSDAPRRQPEPSTVIGNEEAPAEFVLDCPEKIPPQAAIEFSKVEFSELDPLDDVGVQNPSAPKSSTAEASSRTRTPTAFGRYTIQSVLGRGAFGAVYLSFDTQLERYVAIKAPRLELDSSTVEREFLSEARQLAKLNHSGIVSVFDVGIDNSQCYIVSDYLEGKSLSKWLKANKVTWLQAAEVAAELAEALAHAHSHRVVHRDLKPGNVIMKGDRRPVIVDFGLAASDAGSVGEEKGILAGTPSYMAPEQTRGEGHRIDGRTDIYALGVILYFMLTRQLPYQSKHVGELFRQIQEDEPQPPRQLNREIPREVEAICLRAMAKRFSERYTTADDVAEDLRRLLQAAGSTGDTNTGEINTARPKVPSTTNQSLESIPSTVTSPVDDTDDDEATHISSLQTNTSSIRSSVRRRREAARRHITVVQASCNLFDEEKLLDAIDPEEQDDILKAFQVIAREAVLEHLGSVVQPTDDGLMACFGFPIAREDSSRQAVHAGLQLVEEAKVINKRIRRSHGVQLKFSVSIHSDHAIVEEKEDSLSLTGQVRKVVGQIESSALDDSVLITDATYQLVRGYFDVETLGEQSIKGIGSTLVHAVRGDQAANRLEAAEIGGDLTPLIGRDREVGLLQERWEQASEGMGQVVLLIGEAGLGKSRLVHVIKDHVKKAAGREGKASRSIIEWRTSQNHQNSGLYPAIECLERTLAFEPEMTPADRLDRLAAHLRELSLEGDEEVAVLAALLSIPLAGRYPTPDFSPQQLKERTQQLLLDWMREWSAEQPVLFVVEDLHWVDPSTLEFLELLVCDGLNDSIMTLLTFRPEFQTPWSSLAHQTSVALNRLTKRQVGEMIAARSGVTDIPQSVIDQFVDRTDGVPLFVEEFASMITERAGQDGLEDFSIEEIPSTLQDLLLARLDRMASNVELVQLAAAIGRDFRYDLIAAVSELDDDELLAELGLLVSSELLNQRGRPPRTRYTFKHALIQDAAYDSMVRRTRQDIHRKIGDALESLFPDITEPHPELVAHHLTEAGEPDRAIGYWDRAGSKALEQYAHREAITHLQSGLDVLQQLKSSSQRDEHEIRMRTTLGVPLQATLGYSAPEVEENYNRAHELCGDSPDAFPVLYGLFRYFMLQAKYPKAIELGEQLVRLADHSKRPADVVAANRAIAGPLIYQGNHERAIPHLQNVIAVTATPDLRSEFYSFDVVDPWITSLSYLSWAKWLLGYPDQAQALSREAVQTAEKLAHPFSVALGVSFSQWLDQFNRDVEATRSAADRALSLSEEHGFAFWIGWGKVLRGWARAHQGESDSAITEIEEGISAWRKQGSELGCHFYYAMLAEACINADRLDDAVSAISHGEEFADKTGEGYYRSELHRLRGLISLLRSDRSNARVEFGRALETAQLQKAKSLELRAAISMAKLLMEDGETAEAKHLLCEVVNWFTEGFDTKDYKQAKLLLAELS